MRREPKLSLRNKYDAGVDMLWTGTPMVNATEANDMPRDKHWMGLVEPADSARRQLHFVQNLDPLRILRCSLEGMCQFVQRDEQSAAATDEESGFIFRDSFSHLRGGTPFELYRWPYFIRFSCICCSMKQNRNKSAQNNLGRGPRRGAVAHERRPHYYNGAPQIRPQKYPFPWTDRQTPLPAYDAKTASGCDPPFSTMHWTDRRTRVRM